MLNNIKRIITSIFKRKEKESFNFAECFLAYDEEDGKCKPIGEVVVKLAAKGRYIGLPVGRIENTGGIGRPEIW